MQSKNYTKPCHVWYIRYMSSRGLQETTSCHCGSCCHAHPRSCPVLFTWVTGIITPIIGRRTTLRTMRFKRHDVASPTCRAHRQYYLDYGTWLISWSSCNSYDKFGLIRITRHTSDSDLPQATQTSNAKVPICSYLEQTIVYIISIGNTSTGNCNLDNGFDSSIVYVIYGHG